MGFDKRNLADAAPDLTAGAIGSVWQKFLSAGCKVFTVTFVGTLVLRKDRIGSVPQLTDLAASVSRAKRVWVADVEKSAMGQRDAATSATVPALTPLP